MNTQQSNHFLNYQNYHHHDQLHHQYFDENPQGYNPYANSTVDQNYGPVTTATEQIFSQDNFPTIQSNELYEFLPEEIFQLDSPILKSESQHNFNNGQLSNAVQAIPLPFNNGNSEDPATTNHSFLDLSSGQIQTKYPPIENFSEINNNSNFQSGVENPMQPKLPEVQNAYSFQISQEVSARINCAENHNILKRKYQEIESVKQTPPQSVQSFHLSPHTKRENNCLQQSTSYYNHPPEVYASFSSKQNDMFRSYKYN